MNQNRVLLLGSTNVGKTTLFNALTDSQKKVANYHGATTTLSKAVLKDNEDITVYDLPGTYNLSAETRDEALTIETLKESEGDNLWLFILDAVELKKGLTKLKKFFENFDSSKARILIAVNMIDEAKFNGIDYFEPLLTNQKDLKFAFVSGKRKEKIEELKETVVEEMKKPSQPIKDSLHTLNALLNNELIKNSHSKQALRRVAAIDKFLLSPYLGPLFFVLIMTLLFQSVFTWATPFMDAIEAFMVTSGDWVSSLFTNELAKSFVLDALFGGLGAFLVFTPQIFILAFLIKILEESGYLSRASLICHGLFKRFGLSGESFIPILTSHACAIPGIYATRTIKSDKVRILTLLSLPLTVCSARLPVYALLITVTVPTTSILGGLFGLRGLILFSLYLFGILMTLFVSAFISKTSHKRLPESHYKSIELTRYKVPQFKKSFFEALKTCYNFVKDAGLIIFLTNTFIWILATLPNGPGHMKTSVLSYLGKTLNFAFQPLGMEWQETVAVLTSFLARETFVSTLGTLYNIDSDEVLPLAELIKRTASQTDIASSISLIVFFAVALQCVSTVALLRTELPKKIWATYLLGFYFVLAYVLSFITYRLALLIT